MRHVALRVVAVLSALFASPILFGETAVDSFGNPWMANLRELPPPEPVPWWPPGPGWYGVGLLFALAVLWFLWRAARRWRADRYRRTALAELLQLETASADRGASALTPLPALLKRAALAAYPRSEVAALYGEAWHGFLDRAVNRALFAGRVGAQLSALAYRSDPRFSPEESRELLEACRQWLRGHRRELPPC